MALSLAHFAEGQEVIRPIHMTLLELERAFLVDQRGWGQAGTEQGVLEALGRLCGRSRKSSTPSWVGVTTRFTGIASCGASGSMPSGWSARSAGSCS